MTDPDILDEDFRAALKEMHGYIDITEEDLVKIYGLALEHARRRVMGNVLVDEVMNKGVISIQAEAHIHEAESLLFRHRISGLPVVDKENRVVGVISEKDFLYRMEDPELFTFMDRLKHYLHQKELQRKIKGDTVGDVMTRPPITVRENTTVNRVATLLVEKGINRVPVVDVEGKLVGIVSRNDLVKALHDQGGKA